MSKTCPNCKKNIPDGTVFCTYCGSKVLNGSGTSNGGSNSNYSGGNTANWAMGKSIPEEFKELIVQSDEQYIAGLKDSAVKTFASGNGIGTNKIFFTNKRFYGKTNHFSLKNGIKTDNFIIPLENITGINIVHSNPIQWIVAAIISIITIILPIIFIIGYFVRKGTYLEIAYPGNVAKFSVKMYQYNTIIDFQKKLSKAINI